MKNISEEIFDVIIIGSGPAGYTAGIYTSRANLNVALFEGNQIGGQLTTTNDIENFPGFPNGISGMEIMELMRQQTQRFGTKFFNETIVSVNFDSQPFSVETQKGTNYKAKSVIVATGTTFKTLGVAGELNYWGYGISACAVCDGFFYKNKNVIVVGGGDTALSDALYLANIASKVTIVHRRQFFRASKVLLERAKNNPKIEFILDCIIEEFLGEIEKNRKSLTGVRIKNQITNEVIQKNVDGVFLAIGHIPNTNLFKEILDIDSEGYLITKENSTYTNIPGIFACGDVQDPVYRQAITAAGSGSKAGIDVERWLRSDF